MFCFWLAKKRRNSHKLKRAGEQERDRKCVCTCTHTGKERERERERENKVILFLEEQRGD